LIATRDIWELLQRHFGRSGYSAQKGFAWKIRGHMLAALLRIKSCNGNVQLRFHLKYLLPRDDDIADEIKSLSKHTPHK